MSLVVVGVDNSEGSHAAAAFGLEEARMRKATLRIVHAWQVGYVGAGFEVGYPPIAGELDEYRGAADAVIDEVVAVLDAHDVELERRVVEGSPAAVLIDESRGADLLVVGSRGRGGFSELLLGSVSLQCAHHASCPVVIVRDSRDRSG